jgi:GDPmannose 4,6-dehydratase
MSKKNQKNSRKVALIFGITGQDGSYLAELLLTKGYEVHGVRRRSSSFNTARIDHLINQKNIWEKDLFLHYGDLEDSSVLNSIIQSLSPDEIYNLAAQSHVGLSFDQPIYTIDVAGLGAVRILESVYRNGLASKTRYYQASTSELFGGVSNKPFTEDSIFIPQSPYAAAKLLAYWMTRNYREGFGIFAVNGILFNHESSRRGETFVTRKITRGFAKIKEGVTDDFVLGNLDAVRDWGHAKDYVSAMWAMLQTEIPQDFVIATGEAITVRTFVEKVADKVGFKIVWSGKGLDEVGIDANTGKILIKVDKGYFRPLEVNTLLGDASKARKILNWEPQIKLEEMIDSMLEYDLALVRKEKMFPNLNRQ